MHPTPPPVSVLSYLDELGPGSGQQAECAGKLPEEALCGLPEAGSPHPLQELLQAGTGLDASGPVEATQRGAWGKEGVMPSCPRREGAPEGARPQLAPSPVLPLLRLCTGDLTRVSKATNLL